MERYMCEVFQRVDVTIAEEFLNSLPIESTNEKYSFLEEIASTAELKIDFDKNGVHFHGSWNQILSAKECLENFIISLCRDVSNHRSEEQSISNCSDWKSIADKNESSNLFCSVHEKDHDELEQSVHIKNIEESPELASIMVTDNRILCLENREEFTSDLQEHEVYVDIRLTSSDTYLHDQATASYVDNITTLQNIYEKSVDEYIQKPSSENQDKIFLFEVSSNEDSFSSNKENVKSREEADIFQMCNNLTNNDNIPVNVLKSKISQANSKQTTDMNSASSEEMNTKKNLKKNYEELAPYKFFCPACSFKTKRRSHYKHHLQLHKRKCKLHKCDKCNFSTLRLGHLCLHKMTHTETIYTCSKCTYRTHVRKFLLRHQKIKHGSIKQNVEVEILSCSKCGYSTRRLHLMKRHMRSHINENAHMENTYQCNDCQYKTRRKEHYVRHINNVHKNKRPYLCDHCGKAFKRPDALKQHTLVTHTEYTGESNDFCCKICGKRCRSQSQLNQHQVVHSNVRSFLCEICGASFKTRAIQRKHVQTIHRNPKSYTCEVCLRKFNTSYALRRHNKQHSLMENNEQTVISLETESIDQVIYQIRGEDLSDKQIFIPEELVTEELASQADSLLMPDSSELLDNDHGSPLSVVIEYSMDDF